MRAAAEKGGGGFRGIKLSLCENPLPPLGEAVRAAKAELGKSNRYTEPYSPELRGAIARYAGAPEALVHINAGSELILRQLFGLFGQKVHLIAPTYTLFEEIARKKTFTYLKEGDGFRLDMDDLEIPKGTSLAVIVNINNPTGGVFDLKDRIDLLEDNRKTMFLVDEAFIEFGGRPVTGLVEGHDNLIVTRTFSKGFSLAGSRVGYAVAPGKWARHLNGHNDAYPLARASEAAAVASLRNIRKIRERVKRLKGWARDLSKGLERLGIKTYPSEGYFFLARLPVPADRFARGMLKRHIMIKPLKQAGLGQDFVKFVTSTPANNRAVLKAAEAVLP